MWTRIIRSTPLLLLAASLGGCLAAAAGAGAATGIYLTTRGASSLIEGSVPDVARRTEAVFADLGIPITGRETEDSKEIELRGKKGDLDIKVEIERETARTSDVSVEAQRSAVEWDQDYAKMILERIAAKR